MLPSILITPIFSGKPHNIGGFQNHPIIEPFKFLQIMITFETFKQKLYNFISEAIQKGISGSIIADTLQQFGVKRETALQLITAVGAQMNQEAHLEMTWQEAFKAYAFQDPKPKAPEASPVKEATTGRECYAFALYVGGELSHFITAGCWLSQDQAELWADGMSLAALNFKKTASVGVYKLETDDVYKLYTSRQSHNNEKTVFKIHKSRLEGRDYIRPNQDEQRAFYSLLGLCASLPVSGPAALPVGWMK